jgi:peptide/nickel transport system permease protein
MIRYIARRLLQMIPTLLGVILITFVLFNVVGGSPALAKLGKNATPKSLEEFDELRGFNKPLFFGRTVTTRAYRDHDFANNAGPWSAVSNASYVADSGSGPAHLVIHGVLEHVPLAFPLREDTGYEWTIRYASGDGPAQRVVLAATNGSEAAALPATLTREGRDTRFYDIRLRRVQGHPLDSQLVFFLGQLARLDFGVSSSQNIPVLHILKHGIGPTLSLAVPILVLEVVLSLALALLCAYYRGRWPDRAMVVASTVLMSVNYLVWIVAGQYILAYQMGWFPVWGYESWAYLALPVLIGVTSGLGAEVRFYRSVMLDELYRDYVRTAFAKGVSTQGVLFRHVLKNAMIPVITNVVLSIPFLYTGSLLLESYFGIPGLGYLGVNAINDADVDVIRAIVVIGSVLYLLVNLLADVLYTIVDPRVRLS